MTTDVSYQTYRDCYEYHGNTAIVLTRKRGNATVWQDWLLFDSVEEAAEYFNTSCCPGEASWKS